MADEKEEGDLVLATYFLLIFTYAVFIVNCIAFLGTTDAVIGSNIFFFGTIVLSHLATVHKYKMSVKKGLNRLGCKNSKTMCAVSTIFCCPIFYPNNYQCIDDLTSSCFYMHNKAPIVFWLIKLMCWVGFISTYAFLIENVFQVITFILMAVMLAFIYGSYNEVALFIWEIIYVSIIIFFVLLIVGPCIPCALWCGKKMEEDHQRRQEPNRREMEGTFDQMNNQQPPGMEANPANPQPNRGVMSYLRKTPAGSLMDNLSLVKDKWKKNFSIQDSSDVKEPQKCSVCLEEFKAEEEIIELHCNYNHIFHPKCIESWMHQNQSCPLCRQNIIDIIQKEEEEMKESDRNMIDKENNESKT